MLSAIIRYQLNAAWWANRARVCTDKELPLSARHAQHCAARYAALARTLMGVF